jgi:hypothetical protein
MNAVSVGEMAAVDGNKAFHLSPINSLMIPDH